MNDSGARYNVPGLERGLRLLQLFNRSRRILGPAEIGQALGIARSTAFRLAHTLERLGFLERTGEGYRIGASVMRLGFEYIASLDVSELGRPVIERLRDDSDLSAQLVIRDATEVVIIARAAAASTFASNVNVGTRLPAHATILGRVLLCDADEKVLEALYPGPLPRVSPRSPRTLAELKKLLRQDAARGYAVSESYFESGISAVAAPVRDHSGRIVAALSVTAQRPRLEPKERDRLVKLVLHAAADLSRRLNFRIGENSGSGL
jgi:DNA-binding IclR family transcriptional regulator